MQRVRRVRPEVESLESRDVAAIFTASSQASRAAAIRTSNSNGQADTIRVVRNIDLAATPLPAFSRDAGHAVTLDGAGHKVRRVGAAPFRILENAGARLTVENIHLAGGVAMEQGGGGIFNRAGQLTLDRVTLTGNYARDAAVGAAMLNFTGATLTVHDSLIASNHSATFGGGIRNIGRVRLIDGTTFVGNSAGTDGGGGLCNFFGGVVDLVQNCTFTQNVAERGAGVCNHGFVSFVNCTFVGNRARVSGGGIENDHRVPLLINTIVANNINGDVFPNAPLLSWNNLIGGQPRLGRLQRNGGPTPTMAPLPGSPALRLGTTYRAPSIDQRGLPRPSRGPIDIGAVQVTRVGAATNLG